MARGTAALGQGLEPPLKKGRLEAANIIVQFQSDTGDTVGPQLDLPHDATPAQLETLLNGLLQQKEKLPYSFFIEEQPLADDLGVHLHKHKVSVEAALRIVYQLQAVFRVRPVSRCTASLAGHTDAVLAVGFSPDGRHLASGSGDTTARLWDLATQTPLHTCKGHSGWVLCVAWSPDAAILATGGMDSSLWLWDPRTGRALGTCKGHTKWVTSVAWEPAHVALPCRRLASGSKDSTVRVWDAQTRRCLFSMGSHTKAVSAVRWAGDGHIISAARDCAIFVWDAQDGHLVRSLKGHGHWVNTLALSAEFALRTGAFDHTGAAPAEPAAAQAQALQRYEAALGGRPERLASGSDDFTMFLWEPSTSDKPLARMTGHLQLINQVQFSPDGRWVVSASFDKAVKLWDGLRGTFIATLRGHVGPVYQVAWSADSRLLVSASKDSTLKVWDVATRKLKLELPGHADEVFTVDWSPDGASVASGSKDRLLRLWRQ
ncbi:hypothetical protein WJX81_005490 [Elliptochloris bilobata]|uniref:NLE domain-containing protein n=1 Tax=Elliptochloris bilobata TaxID=381761 RepID=A0AAW1S4E4_9CHLO